MVLLYDRQLVVTIADLTLSDLRIQVTIERSIDESQQVGEATIWNLSPDHEDRIYKRADSVEISAGYPETEASLFSGFVKRVRRVRKELSRQTIVELGDSMRKGGANNPKLGGITRQTLRGSTPIRDIVKLIVQDVGLTVGPLDLIPAEATFEDWSYHSRADTALTTALRRVQCTWFEDDGVIRINKAASASGSGIQSDASTIHLDQTNGMIGRPTDTDDGVEVTMLLNPVARLGGLLILESEFIKGAFKIVGLKHEADNWATGKFQTWVDMRPLGD